MASILIKRESMRHVTKKYAGALIVAVNPVAYVPLAQHCIYTRAYVFRIKHTIVVLRS